MMQIMIYRIRLRRGSIKSLSDDTSGSSNRNKILRAYILCRNTPERQVWDITHYPAVVLNEPHCPRNRTEKNSLQKYSQRNSWASGNYRSLQGQGWGATLVAHAMKVSGQPL